MLVLLLYSVRVQNTIDLKDLNTYLSEIKISCANIKIYQNLSNCLCYFRPAGTIFKYDKKSYFICLSWNKEIYKLANLIGKRVYKLYKTKKVATLLILSYHITLWIKIVISWTDITFDKTTAIFSTRVVVLKLQQFMFAN